jgi:serine/threonine-protein kinase
LREQYRAGDEFGRYRLEQLLGAGGFGAVWRALDTSNGQIVALKLLSGAYSGPDAMRLRAEVELLAASAASSSPHVVRVLGGGPAPVPHVVMEYVQGEDLAALLRREGALPPARVVEIGRAVADALRALGEAGIIHRDLKPANVMIDSSGVIKLADFGIAKIVGYETVTATGQVLLSTAYSAPEVWEGKPSARSDLYALGALLYECLTGRTPFVGTTAELFRQHAFNPPDMDALPSNTPAGLRELIERSLEKTPELRPPDAAACLELLERADGGAEPSHFGDWTAVSPPPTPPGD